MKRFRVEWVDESLNHQISEFDTITGATALYAYLSKAFPNMPTIQIWDGNDLVKDHVKGAR